MVARATECEVLETEPECFADAPPPPKALPAAEADTRSNRSTSSPGRRIHLRVNGPKFTVSTNTKGGTFQKRTGRRTRFDGTKYWNLLPAARHLHVKETRVCSCEHHNHQIKLAFDYLGVISAHREDSSPAQLPQRPRFRLPSSGSLSP